MRITQIFMLLIFFYSAQAQNEQNIEEKIEAKKIAFITTELDLTSEEAQDFWPIYNSLSNELKEAKSDRKHKKNENFEHLSDSEAISLLNEHIETQERELAIKKKYTDQFLQVLPPQKVLQLYSLERAFKSRMINSLKKRMRNRNRRN